MNSGLPNTTRSVFRTIGAVRRPHVASVEKTSTTAKPFYQQSAKKQMEKYLKTVGGKSYLKSPFEKGFRSERQAFEHGQREGMTKEELYAFSKIAHGGVITKERAKLIAGAAIEIGREHEAEAGELAGGLSHGKLLESEKKLMRMQGKQEAQPKPVEKKPEKTAGQKLASLQQRLHIQHSPMVDHGGPAMPAVTEPTNLNAAPAHPAAEQPRWQPPTHEQPTPQTPPPSAPRLSQFSSGFTGGSGVPSHPTDDHADAYVSIPVYRSATETAQQHPTNEPAQSEPAGSGEEQSSVQLPDTSHVDEGLPF